MIPRALFSNARQRRELERTGVYILVGPPEEGGLPRIYVGEGDPIRPRLDQHASRKDFWTNCVAFTSKDENLNKAHVQYLEARLVALASQNKRCVLDNGNVPALPSMSEADAADAEGFLTEVLLCLPVLGITVFTGVAPSVQSAASLYINAKGVTAEGSETADGFLVRAGSTVVRDETPSCHTYLKQLRATLLENGVTRETDQGFAFTQDYLFASPSTAAGVILARASNGRTEWRTADGTTLKQLQQTE